MQWYRIRVERDLARWQEQGFVTAEGARGIRADLEAEGRKGIGAAQVFAVLGAVLFGFAVMSFVAANWEGMSKLARLVLLLLTLWACYGGATILFARNHDYFANACVLGGIAAYGASIMLIAQMYHMEGNPPDAVLLWALGALLAAALIRSGPALAATFVLALVWTYYERSLSESGHFAFLLLWAAAAAVAYLMAWRPGLHLAALSLVLWVIPLGAFVLDRHAHWLVVVLGIAGALATSVGAQLVDRFAPTSRALFAYMVATAYAALFILQFIDDAAVPSIHTPKGLAVLIALGVLSLALLLGAMLWGLNTDNRPVLWLAYTGFAVEIFALYGRTFGDLLNTSLFFLVAAVIVSALAWLAYRLHNRREAMLREAR